MGGLPCAKEIHDNRAALKARLAKAQAALDKALDCMQNSMNVYLQNEQPTYEQRDRFLKLTGALGTAFEQHAESLAAVASEIEEYVRTGS
jgi:hypothetical protein